MLNPVILINIEEKKSDSNGHFCRYFKLSKDVGIKYCDIDFHHTDDTDMIEKQFKITFDCSVLLYELGVGPRVWDFQVIRPGVCLFFTEHASTVFDITEYNIHHVIELYKTIILSGYSLSDIHTGNIGMIDNKYVIIDGGCIGSGFYLGSITCPEKDNYSIETRWENLLYYIGCLLDEFINDKEKEAKIILHWSS